MTLVHGDDYVSPALPGDLDWSQVELDAEQLHHGRRTATDELVGLVQREAAKRRGRETLEIRSHETRSPA